MKHLRHYMIAIRTGPRLIPQLKYRLSGICGLLLLALLFGLLAFNQQLERAYSESRAILDATNEAMLLLAPDGQVLSSIRASVSSFPRVPMI